MYNLVKHSIYMCTLSFLPPSPKNLVMTSPGLHTVGCAEVSFSHLSVGSQVVSHFSMLIGFCTQLCCLHAIYAHMYIKYKLKLHSCVLCAYMYVELVTDRILSILMALLLILLISLILYQFLTVGRAFQYQHMNLQSSQY